MKKTLFLCLFFINSALFAQTYVDWTTEPGGVSIAVNSANEVFTANWEYAPAGDITLTKRSPAGTVLWSAKFDNTDGTKHEVATWVETDNLGNILVSGTIRSGYSNPVNANSVLMKFGPTGTLLWRQVYGVTFDGSSTRKCVVDSDNNIYVFGLNMGPNGLVSSVKKFAPDGTSPWIYHDTDGIGGPVNIKITPDNHLLLTGRSSTGILNGFLKINLSGTKIWSMAGLTSHTLGDAAGDASGNSYLVNNTSSSGSIKKLSPAGALLWEQTFAAVSTKVEVGTDNFPVAGGFPGTGTFGVSFVKYNAAGTKLWENLDADGPNYNLMLHAQMKLDNTNAAYLAAGTLFEVAVCKVNPDGTSAWVETSTGGYANAFDFGSDNSVFVVSGMNAAHYVEGTPPPPPPPVCGVPLNLRETAVASNTATLRWKNMGAAQYTVQWKQNGLAWNTVLTTDTFLIINNLTAFKGHTWRIRAKCGTVWTAYSALRTFTTPQNGSTCTSPTEISIIALTANAGIAEWPAYAGATQYQVRRRVLGTTTWTTATVTTDQYLLSGLTANTTYQLQIRTRCGSTWFPFSPIHTFTTPAFLAGADDRFADSEKVGVDQPETALSIFPNPANGLVNLKLNIENWKLEPGEAAESDARVEIFDAAGKLVFSDFWNLELGENGLQFDATDWKSGVYIVRLTAGETVFARQLVVF